MCISGVEGVSEVHEEGITLPPEAVLDEGIRKVCSVEEVCCRNADGVSGPQ